MKTQGWIGALLTAALMALVIALLVQLRATPRPAVVLDQVAAPAARLATNAPMAPPAAEAETAWSYETLTAEERAVVDRGRDTSQWEGVHRGFSEATPVSAPE